MIFDARFQLCYESYWICAQVCSCFSAKDLGLVTMHLALHSVWSVWEVKPVKLLSLWLHMFFFERLKFSATFYDFKDGWGHVAVQIHS